MTGRTRAQGRMSCAHRRTRPSVHAWCLPSGRDLRWPITFIGVSILLAFDQYCLERGAQAEDRINSFERILVERPDNPTGLLAKEYQ